jgi:hypothetical protein
MRKRLATFDSERDRGEVGKLAKLFEFLWPDRKIRLFVAKRLASSIRVAHKRGPASWEVTAFDWGIRLNVGQVLVLQFDSEHFLAYERIPRGRSVYAAVRVPSRSIRERLDEVDTSRKAWIAHERFIVAAADAKKVSPWQKSFSEGALKYLESILHVPLPRPAYFVKSAPQLHLLQGGIQNGDKKWLEGAAIKGSRSPSWIAPKSCETGDEAIIYISGYGFFATARIASEPHKRTNWKRRYGIAIDKIALIDPPISLVAIRSNLPNLKWAKYPRSVTTLSAKLAAQVRRLVETRRKSGVPQLAESELPFANLAELRRLAILSAKPKAAQKAKLGTTRQRSRHVHRYVLRRSDGSCESCTVPAPFYKSNGDYYLEPHHTKRLADDGPDHPASVIALCPTCHRRAHYSSDGLDFNRGLIRKLSKIELQD